MKKSLLPLLLFFSCYKVLAQNYQPVYSTTESFYIKNPASVIYGIKPDSFTVNAADTIFYHYKTVTDTNSTSFYPGCADLVINYPTWQGEKTIIKSGGTAVFFNAFQDSIFIQCNTVPSQSWLVYTFANGDMINANHVSTSYETVGGFSDTVKRFSLDVRDGAGNPLSHPLNGKEMLLSKSKGWFVSFNWRDFPADTSRWTIEPAMRLTNKELNAMYPGDVVYISGTYSAGPTANRYETILTRQDFGNDSIVFEVARQVLTPVATGGWPPYTWNTTYDTLHRVITNPNAYIFPGMPEQVNNTGFIADLEGYYMERFYSGSCIKYKYDQKYRDLFYYEQDSSCYSYTFEPVYTGSFYVSGTGNSYYYNDYQSQGGPYYYQTPSLYSDSCGNHINVGVPELLPQGISVFPNPAKNFVTVTGTGKNAQFHLYDLGGREINASGTVSASAITIDLSPVSTGIYILQLWSGERLFSFKIIRE
jgi:hypothetical protein